MSRRIGIIFIIYNSTIKKISEHFSDLIASRLPTGVRFATALSEETYVINLDFFAAKYIESHNYVVSPKPNPNPNSNPPLSYYPNKHLHVLHRSIEAESERIFP